MLAKFYCLLYTLWDDVCFANSSRVICIVLICALNEGL